MRRAWPGKALALLLLLLAASAAAEQAPATLAGLLPADGEVAGLMNNYVFDRENIFRLREGFIGSVEGCRAMVFRYASDCESAEAFAYATGRLSAGSRFTSQSRQENRYAMVDRDRSQL